MKNFIVIFLLATALFLLREEWVPHYLSPFNVQDSKTIYMKVFVIGDRDGNVLFKLPTGATDKWLTPEEAAEYNKANEAEPKDNPTKQTE